MKSQEVDFTDKMIQKKCSLCCCFVFQFFLNLFRVHSTCLIIIL